MLYESGSTAAIADSYTFTENALLDSGLLTGNVITLDTLSNDVGNLAIYSIDDGAGSTTVTAAQLQNDDLKKTATTSAWETLTSGDRIRVVDGKIELDITASLTRLGVTSVAELADGQTITLSFAYAVQYADGTKPVDWTTVSFTLTGQTLVVNHVPVIGGTDQGAVAEDMAELGVASGTLTITDDDAGEAAFMAPTDEALQGTYGNFTFNAATGEWGYTLDNTRGAVQALRGGQIEQDTLTVTSLDGSASHTITVQVAGTNDKSSVSVTVNGALVEDVTGMTSGTVTVTDPDFGEARLDLPQQEAPVELAGRYGTFAFTPGADGTSAWTYTLTNNHPDVQALPEGDTLQDRVQLFTADGQGVLVQVNIVGTNDLPVVGGVATGAVAEDGPTSTVSGQLTIADVDAFQSGWTVSRDGGVIVVDDGGSKPLSGTIEYAVATGEPIDSSVDPVDPDKSTDSTESFGALRTVDPVKPPDEEPVPSGIAGRYGTFIFDGDTGEWQYTLNNALVQSLAQGVEVKDTLKVVSRDGTTTRDIVVTITGTNDVATISGDSYGKVSDDGSSASAYASGTLLVKDVDSGQAFFAGAGKDSTPQSFAARYGTFTFDAGTGAWTYAMATGSDAVRALGAGDTDTDELTVHSLDGTASQTITVLVTGANDAASIVASGGGSVREDGNSTVTGILQLADRDADEAQFANFASQSQYGHFDYSVATTATGATLQWTYLLANANPAVQALRGDQTVSDSFTIQSADGTASQTVTVDVVGANDAAVFSGNTSRTVAAGTSQTTTFGTLVVNDVDTGQSGFQSLGSAPIAGQNRYGNFTFDATTGDWDYMLSTLVPAVRWLGAGQSLTDSLVVRSTDGTSQSIAVTILGHPNKEVLSSAADTVILENNGQTRILVGFNPSQDTIHLGSSFTGLVDRNGNIAAEHWVTFNNTSTFAASEAVPYARMVWIPGGSGAGTLYYVPAMSTTLGTAVAQFGLLASTPQPVDVTLAVMAPAMPAFTGFVTGTEGNDVMSGTAGAETIRGFGGDDVIYTAGADTAYGGAGNDRLSANTSGIAVLYGEDGNDLLFGALNFSSTQRMFGGAGNDTFYGSDSSESMYGGSGDDLMFGGNGSFDVLDGEAGNDWIYGGDGVDRLYGSDGDDHLYGGNGNDFIGGEAGNDWLTGNAGNDGFTFEGAVDVAGVDHITDFTNGEDLIYLQHYSFAGLAIGVTSNNTLIAADFAGLSTGGATADVGAAHVIYDASTGNLYYDADGGSSANRTLFAVLDNKPTLAALDAGDFRVF